MKHALLEVITTSENTVVAGEMIFAAYTHNLSRKSRRRFKITMSAWQTLPAYLHYSPTSNTKVLSRRTPEHVTSRQVRDFTAAEPSQSTPCSCSMHQVLHTHS